MADIKDLDYFDVDQNKLDQELFAQPRNYFNVAKAVADARESVDRQKTRVEVAKEELKRVDADLSLQIRKSPGSFGLDKATEGSIEAVLNTHPIHARAFQALIDAKGVLTTLEHTLGVLDAALGAMDNKKLALGKGVELFIHNYRSTPRTEGGHFSPPETRRAPV